MQILTRLNSKASSCPLFNNDRFRQEKDFPLDITKHPEYFFDQWKIATTNNFHDEASTVTVHKRIHNLQFLFTIYTVGMIIFKTRRSKCLKTLGIITELMVWHCCQGHSLAWWWYLCLSTYCEFVFVWWFFVEIRHRKRFQSDAQYKALESKHTPH